MTSIMAGEIFEQPDALARTFAALRPLSRDVRTLALARPQVLFSARGSSANAATYGRYLAEICAGRAAAALAPSVATIYRRRVDLRHALVVCVSQSGETLEIVESLSWARACGAATLAITNVRDSALAQMADLTLLTMAGPEVAVPATKTFTTQLAAMVVLAGALAPDTVFLDAECDRVPDAVAELIHRRRGVEDAVAALLDRARLLVSGRGLTNAVASELALKLEETCLQPVIGGSYADLLHGPIAIVNDQSAAIVVAPRESPVLSGLHRLVLGLRARGALVVALGGDALLAHEADVAVAGPDLTEPLAPIGLAVAGQMLVERLACELGLDPDAPRGLRKVTQTDAGEPA